MDNNQGNARGGEEQYSDANDRDAADQDRKRQRKKLHRKQGDRYFFSSRNSTELRRAKP
jgi:hypothetical protein